MKIASTGEVVLVDDSDVDATFLKRWLSKSRVTNPLRAFECGRDFLRYMESVKFGGAPMPALVLLDINMPVLNGFETLEALKADAVFRDLPIVAFYTNSDNPYDRRRAADLGALFVVKFSSRVEAVDFFDSLVDADV